MPYEVLVDDNYDYMNETKRYALGVYETYDQAVAASKAIVDECLCSIYRSGMTPEELYSAYRFGGEDPFILATPPHSNVQPLFSAWGYAQESSRELCNPTVVARSVEETKPWWKFWHVDR